MLVASAWVTCGPGLHRAGDQLADRGDGAGGVGGGDGAGAGLHRLDHRPDLLAADLADDLAGEVEAEGVDECVVEGELAGHASVESAFSRAGARLPRVDDLVPSELVQVQLVLGLEGADRLQWIDLGAQRPDQGRLAGPLASRRPRCDLRARTAARRNDAATGVSICRSTRSSRVTSISRCRRITTDGRGVTHAAAARREPPSRRRCSRGWASEKPRALTSRAGGEEHQEVDQLLVGVRHRGPVDQRAVGQFEQDLVVAGDDDVLHPVVIHKRLEPAEPEQRVEDRPGQRVLFGATAERRQPGVDPVGHRGLDQVEHDRASELLLRGLVEAATVGGDRLAELLRGLRAQSRRPATSQRRVADGVRSWSPGAPRDAQRRVVTLGDGRSAAAPAG